MEKAVVSPKKKTSVPKKPAGTFASSLLSRLKEPTTWAGILSLGAIFATGGTAGWLNPQTVPSLAAAVGLILAKEGGS